MEFSVGFRQKITLQLKLLPVDIRIYQYVRMSTYIAYVQYSSLKIKKEKIIYQMMYTCDFHQLPEHATLMNQWMNTIKHGRNDEEIELN